MAGCARTVDPTGLVNPEYAVLTVGSVVIHVALSWMALAPGAFVRDDVTRFGKICRPRVERSVQVIDVNQNPVCRGVGRGVHVAAVIVCGVTRGEASRKRIDPAARTNAVLPPI